jgi:hypothetical protein
MVKFEFINEQDAKKEMKKISVHSGGIKVMVPKSKFRIIKLFSVRNAMANILKEEMLSLGGEVAKHPGCVNCTVESSDILVMGTIRQLKDLIQKLKKNVSECPKIAVIIESALKQHKDI